MRCNEGAYRHDCSQSWEHVGGACGQRIQRLVIIIAKGTDDAEVHLKESANEDYVTNLVFFVEFQKDYLYLSLSEVYSKHFTFPRILKKFENQLEEYSNHDTRDVYEAWIRLWELWTFTY